MIAMGPIGACVTGNGVVNGVAMGEDDALTVQEALAFIDAFEHEGASVAIDAGSRSTAPTSSESSMSDRQSSTDTEADKKKRNSLAVRRCQNRKKQEMLELRKQVQALEEHLKQLQRVRKQQRIVSFDAPSEHKHPTLSDGEAADLRDVSQSVWMDLAQRELVERQRSEALNRQLRAALAKHRELSADLQSVVRARSVDAVRFYYCFPARLLQRVIDRRHLLEPCHCSTNWSCWWMNRRRRRRRCTRVLGGSSPWTTS